MPVAMTGVPPFTLGSGALAALPDMIRPEGTVLIIADSHWARTETLRQSCDALRGIGLSVCHYTDFTGEPKARDIRKATVIARERNVGQIIGLGGGTALDTAKLVAACAVAGADPEHFALGRRPIPQDTLPTVLIPTTAGTGSEANGTAIFANDTDKKFWVYGAALKAGQVILDPDLTASLPPHLAAWCGMDALVHAFEAATNRWSHPVSRPFALRALELISGALEPAVANPEDVDARADLLLGSFHAGYAIENCGTSVAHNVSHALAALAPVHHGFATALAFERTLPWVLSADTGAMEEAARACGAKGVATFAERITSMMNGMGIERELPEAFADFTSADMAREMRAEENTPMRNACLPDMTDEVLDRIAADIMALVPEIRP